MVAINKDKQALLTQELLKEKLHYDKDTGIFTWTDSELNHARMRGREAGCINPNGYRIIAMRFDGKFTNFYVHRLAWLYEYGEFPKLQLDHINQNKLDNRINNLRAVTHGENQRNRSMPKTNKTGFCGVSFSKGAKKYQANIMFNYQQIHLGYFENLEDAAQAVKEARTHYGFHKNHGASE
jgi:hypothetical protein